MTPLRASIYVRQSRDTDDTRAAIDRQEAACRELCERNGWTIVGFHADNDMSATKRKRRPGYDRLFADVRAGACDVIVAWAQDRLLRDIRDGEDLVDLVRAHRVRIATVQGGEHDLNTADGATHVRLMAVIAKAEMEKKSARQKDGARQAAQRGMAPPRGLYGYRAIVERNEHGKVLSRELVTHEPEAANVREAFDRLFRGDSVRSIAAWLRTTGTTTIRGNQWDARGVVTMLTNGRYAGHRAYYGERMAKGNWPAIVTDKELEKAVLLLSDDARRTNGPSGGARKWLGSGLYRCVHCEQPVKSGVRGKDGSRVYVCAAGGKEHLARKAEPIDDYVTRLVEGRLALPDAKDLLAGQSADLKPLRAEAEEIRRKIDRAMRDYADEAIDAATLKVTKDRYAPQLAAVERKMAHAVRDSTLARLGAAADPVEAFRSADLAVRREVVDALLTARLLPGKRGNRPFDPATVDIKWRGA